MATAPAGRLRLFCFPHAGGMAHLFRAWSAGLSAGVDVLAVELAGRGARLREPAHRDIGALIDDLWVGLRPFLSGPVAFFGHSMGAIVAFELARRWRREEGKAPVQVMVSGHRAPHRPRRRPELHLLPEADFVAALASMQGTPAEVLQNAALMEVMTPLLRADLQAVERYAYLEEAPLSCPITAFGGLSDGGIDPPELEAWREHGNGAFRLHLLPGGHFFVNTSRTELLALVAAELRAAIGSQRGARPEEEERCVHLSQIP